MHMCCTFIWSINASYVYIQMSMTTWFKTKMWFKQLNTRTMLSNVTITLALCQKSHYTK